MLGLDPRQKSTGIPGSDLLIIKGVLHELMADPGVIADRVDLSSQGGLVTLSGIVGSPLVARRATAAAERVAGVLAVVDEIEIHPPPRPDHELENDVRLLLRIHVATAPRKLNASVRDGVITLEGSVVSLAEKNLAEEVVLAVNGIRGIAGSVQIVTDPPRSDDEIRQDVLRRLRYDARVDARDVTVRVQNSVVDLTGSVGSAAERVLVREDAEVSGATAIDLQKLHVDPARLNKQRVPRSPPSDTELALAVQTALDHDPRIGNGELGSFVGAGTVKLHGRVESPAARRAAERTASSLIGVHQVVNDTQVRPQQRIKDSELQGWIRRCLRAHADVDATDLEVAVRNRVAALRGPVRNEFERTQVIDVAANVSGVLSVIDELRVLTPRPSQGADAQLRREISSRLTSDPSIEIEELQIGVAEGVVTLSGRVPDEGTHDRVMLAATRAGARRIVDDLDIVQHASR